MSKRQKTVNASLADSQSVGVLVRSIHGPLDFYV
jgi:hypothetical protein